MHLQLLKYSLSPEICKQDSYRPLYCGVYSNVYDYINGDLRALVSLSSIISNMGLTHLGSEASKYV